MKRLDIRPTILANALANEGLGHAERVFLMTVVALATEYVDGKVRPGSKAMNDRGHFALHYDYLGRATGTSKGNAEKMLQRMTEKGYFSKVHNGTFGRPPAFQALNVRADKRYGVTFRPLVRPYEIQDPAVRADTTSALTYKTPDQGDHPPRSGEAPQRALTERRLEDRSAAPRSAGRPAVCEWHEHMPCDPDCANHPANGKRTA